MSNSIIFLDGPEKQWICYWLGIPYLIESSFGGRMLNALTKDEQSIDFDLEGLILHKFMLTQRLTQNTK